MMPVPNFESFVNKTKIGLFVCLEFNTAGASDLLYTDRRSFIALFCDRRDLYIFIDMYDILNL